MSVSVKQLSPNTKCWHINSKTTCSEQGQAKFITVYWAYIHCNIALCKHVLAFMERRVFVCVCTVISAPPALTQQLVSISACFSKILQMCRDNVPGSFRETGCLVKRSCPGSFLPQGVQQEILEWLQKELMQEAALINAPSARGAHCQSLETYHKWPIFTGSHKSSNLPGNDTHIRN